MAEREIVSAGHIQFDEDGEPVGFEEQKFRRDGASVAPLTPGEGPPADGASEESQGEQEPAPAAGEEGDEAKDEGESSPKAETTPVSRAPAGLRLCRAAPLTSRTGLRAGIL